MTLLPTSNICISVSGVGERQIYNKDRSRSRHPHPSVIAHLLLLIYDVEARGEKGMLGKPSKKKNWIFYDKVLISVVT